MSCRAVWKTPSEWAKRELRRARIDQVTEPKLTNPAQPLERRGLDHAPQHPFESVALVEFDQIVDRIADPLAFQIRHECVLYLFTSDRNGKIDS